MEDPVVVEFTGASVAVVGVVVESVVVEFTGVGVVVDESVVVGVDGVESVVGVDGVESVVGGVMFTLFVLVDVLLELSAKES
ncbi:MAG TPA: hypothetical protein VLY66_00085 [Candidatus Eisenbacteria bacterium]|nr:hypothetical protein [Candidatus Eisenbacteria bacterium]